MLILPLLLAFLSVFSFFLGFVPFDSRPTLQLTPGGGLQKSKPKNLGEGISDLLRKTGSINKPFTKSALGQRIFRDLMLSQTKLSVEEFFLVKEVLVLALIWISMKVNPDPSFLPFSVLMSIAGGYIVPEFWLKGKVKKVKESILRDLPDTVDLLGLCVNAGLDFMMALRYVIEKSRPSVIVEELRIMLQEINVGKPRREALRDMARKYEMPDLSTFSRTLIQADRMGTSVSEALNILSEDMRETRFRRGEAMALKAPLKMLVPLLFCIFPVVAILVAGPVFLDFFKNNPLQSLGK